MGAVPPLGSLMLGSTQVEKSKQWYQDVFGVEANEMGAFTFGNTGIFIEEHSDISASSAAEPARVIINFDVADEAALREIAARADKAGSKWVRPVEAAPFGIIGTVEDPDGNYLQIIAWGATPEAHKDA